MPPAILRIARLPGPTGISAHRLVGALRRPGRLPHSVQNRNVNLILDRRLPAPAGWPEFVRTDMGGPGAHNEPEETVPSLADVIDRLSLEDTGGFYNWDGQTIPW